MGTLWWITGLAGAGKTTVGTALAARLRASGRTVLHLDGDDLRSVFAIEGGYDQETRRSLAMRYARLCKLVTDQGVDVVCSTISLFAVVHQWNRANIARYHEVFLDMPVDTLAERDQKGLYSGVARGDVANVTGVDLPFERPQEPDLVIVNDGRFSPDQVADMILGLEAASPS